MGKEAGDAMRSRPLEAAGMFGGTEPIVNRQALPRSARSWTPIGCIAKTSRRSGESGRECCRSSTRKIKDGLDSVGGGRARMVVAHEQVLWGPDRDRADRDRREAGEAHRNIEAG